MLNYRDEPEAADLQRLNVDLKQGLEHCRDVLADWRSRFAGSTEHEAAEGSYFARRERHEREMSRRAGSLRVAAAHQELADRYEALAVVFGAKRSPDPGLRS